MKIVEEDDPGEPNYCTEIREGANSNEDEGDFNVTILTNDSERLVVRLVSTQDNDSYTETVEYVVNPTGSAMTENWDSDEEEYTYFKTTTTYSSLCN